MDSPMGNLIIVCESVHDVMAFERALKDANIAVEMIPTPRELTSDCGMALEIGQRDVEQIGQLKQDGHLEWRGIFRRDENGFSQII